MDSIAIGQMREANDLGIDPAEVGCDCASRGTAGQAQVGACFPLHKVGADEEEDFWSGIAEENELDALAEVGLSFPNPIKAVSNLTKGVSRAVKSIPVLGAPFKAADKVLNSGINVLQKVLSNPFVSTFGGPFAVPGNLLLATYKGGPKAALEVARAELHNPVRQMAVKAVALVFPPAAPAAAAYEAAQRVDSALRSKDPVAVAKAVAQVAATTALGEMGDPGALKGMEYLKKAKAAADLLPKVNPLTPMSHGRVEVCGAKSEESRGIWLKTHIYREGQFLCATIYSVANANAEVFNLKVDLLPIMKAVAAYHKKLHGNVSVSGFMDNIMATATKLGRAQLASKAFAVSSSLAAKTACNLQTPNVPVSDVALTVYAAARTGVDAVDKNAKLKSAMEGVATNISRLMQVKKHLAGMTAIQKQVALRDPTVKSAVLKGIGSKFALANFIKAGGQEKAKAIRKNAMIASKQFGKLAAQAKAGDPNAKKMAKVVSIAAHTRAKTQQTVQNNAGGAAGMVIDSQGKVRKAHKGFHKRTPKAGEHPQVLIPPKGHGSPQTGIFTAISGVTRGNSWAEKDRRRVRPGRHVANRATLMRRLQRIRQLAVVSGVDPEELIGCLGGAGGISPFVEGVGASGKSPSIVAWNTFRAARAATRRAYNAWLSAPNPKTFKRVELCLRNEQAARKRTKVGASDEDWCSKSNSLHEPCVRSVGVVDSDGAVDEMVNDGISYDAFVQDPFIDLQIPADLPT